MKRAALCALLVSAPLRAADEERFFALASDYAQVLHACHAAVEMDVDARRPLVSLVLSLDEQVRGLNKARFLLFKHQQEPLPQARRAVEGLLSGISLLSLASTQDLADVNAMSDRWELAQRVDSRRHERREAVEVMAASAELFREALYEEVEVKDGRRRKKVRRPRLSREGAKSLSSQLDLFFADEFKGGGNLSPLVEAARDLRRAFAEIAGPPEPPKKSP